jgi:hypothetical protein
MQKDERLDTFDKSFTVFLIVLPQIPIDVTNTRINSQ